jgi:hypothetical protein
MIVVEMKRITRITSCFLLVALVLVGLGETESLVLCIGHDGHIALENVKLGVCNHTLEKLADELGLSPWSQEVRSKAKCCPCADMDLPGRSLDYPEVIGPEVVLIAEPADTPTPLFEPDSSESIYVPCSEVIPRSPPPDPHDTVALISLRSVVILA